MFAFLSLALAAFGAWQVLVGLGTLLLVPFMLFVRWSTLREFERSRRMLRESGNGHLVNF